MRLQNDGDIQRVLSVYALPIYRLAYARTRSRSDAEDICQEVFLELVSRNPTFPTENARRAWLIRVTVNQCKKAFRSPWRRVESIEDYASTLRFETAEDRGLFCGIMRLEQKYRVAVLMYYYEGYSTAEIADILGVPLNTVTTRLSRARAKLKNFLTEDD